MAWYSFGRRNYGLQIGINNAPINNPQFYLPLERPDTPPSPLSTVPFHRDRDFVDRGTLLDQIHEKASVSGSRIALVGLGGVGKSQLAIEYSYRVRDQSPETWVFWIHASNATRFEQSCRDIADQVKIPGRQNPKGLVFKLLHDWLHDEKNGKWVLVLDNLDDDQFLHETPTVEQDGLGSDQSSTPGRSIWSYFPQSLKGLILITSRSRHVVSRMVEDGDIITVEPMDETQAIMLFEKKLGAQSNTEDVTQLAAVLEFMPLTIVQAAAYIKQRAPRLSVAQYLEEFQESDRKKIKFLGYESGHLRRDREAKNAILLTWHKSFDHIRQIRPSAADLLSLMSFFDRQGIPDSLLREDKETRYGPRSACAQDRDETSDSDDKEENESESSVDSFEDDILVLRDYSLISISADATNFEMHRLVQLAMQEWLKAHKQLERLKQRFIRTLYSNFPTGKFENWPRCQLLFAHVQCAVAQKPDAEASLGEWASLLHEAASFAWTRGNSIDSKRMAERATKARKKLFGPENEKTLDSFEMLGLAYGLAGQWKKAEELNVQVMETRKRVLGPDHPDTLTIMGNLALTYWDQGRWKEAEDLHVQVMETRKQVLGPDHPDTLNSMSNLALTFRDQGRWKGAEELQVQVMETCKRVLGPDHPNTLTVINNLASTYWGQGRWKEAEELQVEVMKTCKKVLKPDHPNTLAIMSNLASTYRNQRRWKEAEKLQLQVMETCKRVLGPDNPDTLNSMSNLALTFRGQGRWKEADEVDVQVMETRKRVLGADHPDTLNYMSKLALIYRDQGLWKEAIMNRLPTWTWRVEALQRQVMETRMQMLGPDHPDTLNSMSDLALTFRDQGRWEEAEEVVVQVMETRKRVLGADHADTLNSMSDLASIYCGHRRWKEAEELQVQVMETCKQVVGPDHAHTLNSMSNLASIYWDQGRWKEVEELQVQVMEIRKRVLGPDHPDTLTIMNDLISIYLNQGRWKELEELQVQVMETHKRVLGPDHADTLAVMDNLTSIYCDQGRWKEAEDLQVQVMEIRKRVLGPDHVDTLEVMDNLASTYRNQGRWKEAEELEVWVKESVMETRKRLLGHSDNGRLPI